MQGIPRHFLSIRDNRRNLRKNKKPNFHLAYINRLRFGCLPLFILNEIQIKKVPSLSS